MSRSKFTQPRGRWAAALTALILAGGLAVGGSAPAHALGSGSVQLELLDETGPTGARNISGLVVDGSTHRGYLINHTAKSIEVYDVAGAKVVPLATITTGLSNPFRLALDEKTHRLLVGEATMPNLAVVDIDPSSPTVNSVIKAVSTGGILPRFLAVDGSTAYVCDFTGDKMAKVDIVADTNRMIAVPFASNHLTVDPVAHRVFIAQEETKNLISIANDGTTSTTMLSAMPLSVAVSRGQVLVGTVDQRIARYDPATWKQTGVSPVLAYTTGSMAVDDDYGVIYAVKSGIDPIVQILRTDDLIIEGQADFATPVYGVQLEAATHRIFVVHQSTIAMYATAPSVQRIGGADRFEVSAQISQKTFAPGKTAFIASGATFPDALSAAAAAGKLGGPVLLVEKDRIPSAVADELRRLQPGKIFVVGGTQAVSAAVESALTPYSTSIERITGADRFVVSAAISQKVFAPKVPVAYLASGSNFPDALSGSAVAGLAGAPVLLVRPDSVPTEISDELKRLEPARIVVLGGLASVTAAVTDAVKTIAPTSRIDGADRFVVSAAVSAKTFMAGATTVYIASGAAFPDALSGSPAAIAKKAPILLVLKDRIPTEVGAELDRLNPNRIVVLGGPNAVSDSVLASLKGYIS